MIYTIAHPKHTISRYPATWQWVSIIMRSFDTLKMEMARPERCRGNSKGN
ncbi:MAG TPA: hypothetical protein VE978_02740 [Chitinophagales bacterium]|nr:hypothetical protein [Chitinophagales bacterium]